MSWPENHRYLRNYPRTCLPSTWPRIELIFAFLIKEPGCLLISKHASIHTHTYIYIHAVCVYAYVYM